MSRTVLEINMLSRETEKNLTKNRAKKLLHTCWKYITIYLELKRTVNWSKFLLLFIVITIVDYDSRISVKII